MDAQKTQRPVHSRHTFLPDIILPDIILPDTSSAAIRATSDATVELSTLCFKCQPIKLWVQKNVTGHTTNECEQFIHASTGLQLEKSCEDGCHLCTLIWHGFLERTFLPYAEEFRMDTIEREARMQQVRGATDVKLKIYPNKHSKYIYPVEDVRFVLETFLHASDGEMRGDNILLRTRDDYPLSAPLSTGSESSLMLAMRWIKECATSHTKCNQIASSALPTRLLDVGTADSTHVVRTVPTSQISHLVHYTALSYCWGGQSSFSLTSSGLKMLASGVSVKILPKTIQDAIYLTRRLGIMWLWVDSLCIIQDSVDDWAHESSVMGSVYENAVLTIAAIGAKNSEGGLHGMRDPLMYTPCRLAQLPNQAMIFACPPEDSIWPDERMLWPLHSRGWAMQERILARRTLSFGPYLSWNCREGSFSEAKLQSSPGSISGRFFNSITREFLSEDDYKMLYHMWTSILISFSVSALTARSDRLVASTGLISAIQRKTGWRNVGGLWVPYLVKELLWEHMNPVAGLSGVSPSWSWAAVSGEIRLSYRFADDGTSIADVYDMEISASSSLSDSKFLALQISCVPIHFPSKQTQTPNSSTGLLDDFGYKGLVEVRWDCMERPSNLVFLPLILSEPIIGIVVTPSTKCSGAFERVGFGFILTGVLVNRSLVERARRVLKDQSERRSFIVI